MMKNKITAMTVIALPAILLASPAATLQAAESVKLDDQGGLELSITANRRPQSIDNTLASVTVITRQDIEKLQAQDIIDVLRLQRGINLSRNGGPGSQTSIFIRGAESDQALVLLNGVRVSSATTGAFDWSILSLEQVDRIEIVRGPRAALYGSDAIGGVIEITTRKTGKPYVKVTAGRYDTKKFSAGFADGDANTQVALNISSEKSDGFSATNEKAGAFVFNPDKDPYHKNSVSLAFSRQITQRSKAGVDLFQSNNKVDYDQGNSDAELQTIGAYLETDFSNRWSQKISLSHSNDDLVSRSAFGTSHFETLRNEFNWQNNVALSAATNLILGLNYREDQGKSADFNRTIDNTAVYANLNNKRGPLNLDALLRYDDHSKAGSKLTGQLAAGYDFSDSTTAFASYGTAFKAPNINELYYPGFFGSYAGNPDLKPETSKTFEVGFKSQINPNHRLEASVFQTKVKNMISFSGENNQAINTDKVDLEGLELGYTGQHNQLDWGLNLSLLKAEDDKTGERLIRRPKHKLSLNLGYALSSRTHLGLDATLVGSRKDNDFSTFPATRVNLDSYSILNLSLDHKLGKHVGVGVRVENVTNENYELAYGYNTPKRGAYLTLSYQ